MELLGLIYAILEIINMMKIVLFDIDDTLTSSGGSNGLSS